MNLKPLDQRRRFDVPEQVTDLSQKKSSFLSGMTLGGGVGAAFGLAQHAGVGSMGVIMSQARPEERLHSTCDQLVEEVVLPNGVTERRIYKGLTWFGDQDGRRRG